MCSLSLKVRLKNIDDIWSPDLYINALKKRSKISVSSITLTPHDDGTAHVLYIFEVFRIGDQSRALLF